MADPITLNVAARYAARTFKEYPKAGSVVDGRTVLTRVPNMGSISASFTDYDVQPGIREVPLADFTPTTTFSDRVKNLAAQIQASKTLDPLIVVQDKEEGPYILEGAHRIDALFFMKAKSFPAIVVHDLDE